MKEIAKYEQAIGGDGGTVKAALGVEQSNLVAKVEVAYPLIKIVEPATKALDNSLDKLKAAIPGTWDDALIEEFKANYKAELVKLASE